jgi:hypothetical protein
MTVSKTPSLRLIHIFQAGRGCHAFTQDSEAMIAPGVLHKERDCDPALLTSRMSQAQPGWLCPGQLLITTILRTSLLVAFFWEKVRAINRTCKQARNFLFQSTLEITKLSNTIQGLWFQMNAPAKILHLAFSADLSPLHKASLPFRPDKIHPWVLSEAMASLISKE